MTVRFFSQLRGMTGCDSMELHLVAPLSGEGLWTELVRQFPRLAEARATTRLARNHEYIGLTEMVNNSDEVALIPPVSGG